jgi:hypothetical protein
MSYHYTLNLAHKNNLKKYILQKTILRSTVIKVQIKTFATHKNTFLSSPFHYKTVKTHLSIPTIGVQVVLPHRICWKTNFLGSPVAIEYFIPYKVKI